MPDHKAHAEHNEKLSNTLYGDGNFLDWANTIAFYSALHFVSCKILPNTYNGITCTSIAEAASALKIKGKHEVTHAMVSIILPTISTEYKFLMDASFTARYYNYNVNPHHAKMCQKMLNKIKSACS
ncbi:hypothetical protein [Elizabethkingia meningoseptica]|uniref:hypothetical protein n=1 Tax=Elizabethkingia meningoseptica TaxID=238 RepID=UPI001628C780|nr:hypothetical protein [Elizabethkingia meningoseptica]HAY3553745.1 hypothetical protein [Elizabethkingia meningoseptica]